MSAQNIFKATQDSVRQIKVPDSINSQEIKQFIPELEQEWTVSTQIVQDDGTPFQRSLSRLLFPPSTPQLDFVQLGYYSPIYEGTQYYRVREFMDQETYSSAGEFTHWLYEVQSFELYRIYKHQLLETLTWERQEIESIETNTTLYEVIPAGFTVTLDLGKAVAVSIDYPTEYIEAYAVENQVLTPLSPGFHLGLKPQIKFIFPNAVVNSDPIEIICDLYGVFAWVEPLPKEITSRPRLQHPTGTPFEQRLAPPNISGLRTDFPPLSLGNLPEIQQFQTRRTQLPGLYTS